MVSHRFAGGNTLGMSATSPVTVLAKQRDGKLNRASTEELGPAADNGWRNVWRFIVHGLKNFIFRRVECG